MAIAMDDSHAVMLHLRLSDEQFGSEEEGDDIHRMMDRLKQAILASSMATNSAEVSVSYSCTGRMPASSSQPFSQS